MTRACAVALVIALAACAGRSDAPRHPGLDAEGCGVSSRNVPVSQVVLDSAALSARLGALVEGAAVPDTVSMLVQQRPDSSFVTVRGDQGIDRGVAAALEGALLAELLPPEGEHGAPPYRIVYRVAERALTLGRVRMCPPVLLNRDEVIAAMRRASGAMTQDARAVTLVSVDSTGAVTGARLLSESGDPNVDAVALAIAGIGRYRPARWDGVAVPSTFGLPIEFVVRR